MNHLELHRTVQWSPGFLGKPSATFSTFLFDFVYVLVW